MSNVDHSIHAASSESAADEPTLVLRKHARSRPLAIDGERDVIVTVLKGQRRGDVITLHRGETLVGRGHGVDLRLADRGVSRSHARLSVDERGEVELVDLGSTNGTFVNGERIARGSLRLGDRIRIGHDAVLELGLALRHATEDREAHARGSHVGDQTRARAVATRIDVDPRADTERQAPAAALDAERRVHRDDRRALGVCPTD